jgi:hypothetical protein
VESDAVLGTQLEVTAAATRRKGRGCMKERIA